MAGAILDTSAGVRLSLIIGYVVESCCWKETRVQFRGFMCYLTSSRVVVLGAVVKEMARPSLYLRLGKVSGWEVSLLPRIHVEKVTCCVWRSQ
jgi:hypothetical protein